ncbi:MAG: hypothetical protein DYH08_02855 [Actinobacteria bacterium ATB1]|nr:hypothetical protein [Actinobacteria bacterium ATB1]
MTLSSVLVDASGTDLRRSVDAWRRAPHGLVERAGALAWKLARGGSIAIEVHGPASARLAVSASGPFGHIAVPMAARAIIHRSERVRHFGTRPGASTVPLRRSAAQRRTRS